jgi:Fe-S oxidoreductase
MRRLAAERESGDVRSRSAAVKTDAFDVLAPETDAALRESSLHSRTIRQRTPFDAERLERDKKVDWLNRPTRSQLEFQLAWNPTLVYSPTFQCVGCGHCRIRTDETRMCPAFRNAPDEKASCRAKANLLRGVFDGDLDLGALKGDDARRVAEYCVRCHSCASECPAQVDVPRLAFRLQSAYQAAHGLSVADLFAVRFDDALRLASRFSTLVNAALRVGAFRWALEKTLGLSRRRRLPRLESRPYLSRLPKSSALDAFDDETAKSARRRVVLFVDSFANFFDATLVDAAKSVLELNGVDVVIPSEPQTSGAVSFARGDVDGAERVATRNVSIFRELLRSGAEIVALEPSSAVCIKREYPYFCDDADAKVVYANTTDVCSYLARLDRLGELNRDALRPLAVEKTVGYHAPCRTLALTGGALSSPTPAQTLLEAIPGLKVRRLERGCCGLANYSGFLKTRYSESLRLGARLFLAMRDSGIEVCSSECSLCNLQLLQGVDKRARESSKRVAHVLKLLAASYGLLPLDEAFNVAD